MAGSETALDLNQILNFEPLGGSCRWQSSSICPFMLKMVKLPRAAPETLKYMY